MSEQTYCESIGLKVGDKIRVLEARRVFPEGAVITLVEDDGTEIPYFSDDAGIRKAFSLGRDTGNYLPEGKGWERVVTSDEWIINEGLRDTCPEELREKLIEVVSLAGSTRTDYGKNFSYWKRSDKHPAHPSAVVKFRIPVVQGVVETKPEVQAHDPVNRPSHYMLFPEHQIEFIDVRDVLIERLNGFTPRQIDYWSRAFEYLARAGGKNGVEDIKKAKWYLDRLVGTLEE